MGAITDLHVESSASQELTGKLSGSVAVSPEDPILVNGGFS